MPSEPSLRDLRIAQLTHANLDAVAELHMRAFPDAAMTAFGIDVVRRYYVWLLDGPHDARLMGAWREDRLVAFCAAGWYRGAVSGFLRANRWYLIGRVLRRPSLLGTSLVRDRIVQAGRITLRFSRLGRRAVERAAPSDSTPRFGVLSIATSPEARGTGAGSALMLEAEARARTQGHATMVLTVDPENATAVRFYQRLGWTRRPCEGGRWTGLMEKRLASS